MTNNNRQFSSTMERLDLFFDKHCLTPKVYFAIGIVLSGVTALATRFLEGKAFSWAVAPLAVALLIWLPWLGPRYLQRYNRKLVAGLGTLAFFAPTVIYFFMLWLGQPGWPLDDLMGNEYADFPAFLSTIALSLIVYGLLLLRIKLYSPVSIKRHSKKDLFQ